jgi:hypothetical protein
MRIAPGMMGKESKMKYIIILAFSSGKRRNPLTWGKNEPAVPPTFDRASLSL